jgi:CheY-like chemotaxis protein
MMEQRTRPESSIIGSPNTFRKTLDAEMSGIYPLRILVAEDNIINQKVVKQLLKKLGYISTVASDGFEAVLKATGVDFRHLDPEQALDKARDVGLKVKSEIPFDLVLMDLQMPHCDGYDATKIIRTLTPSYPYIAALTANAMDSDKDKCRMAGMNGHLAKPIDIQMLVDLLRTAYEFVNKQ